MHYFKHNLLDPDDFILQNAKDVAHIPATIIHGANDQVCGVQEARDLHTAYGPQAQLIITEGGHSSKDPGNKQAILNAAYHLSKLGRPYQNVPTSTPTAASVEQHNTPPNGAEQQTPGGQ